VTALKVILIVAVYLAVVRVICGVVGFNNIEGDES
jgi:hypothetical protein